MEKLQVAGGTASAAKLLGIAGAHLRGEIAFEAGEGDAATEALELAVREQDSLAYMEPPPFYFPTRQALGAVLLAQNRAGDAELVYRADLRQYPGNGWSLHGLAQALAMEGKADEAAIVQRGFTAAWASADVDLPASRF
jgi:predicted Zn-dependent protease